MCICVRQYKAILTLERIPVLDGDNQLCMYVCSFIPGPLVGWFGNETSTYVTKRKETNFLPEIKVAGQVDILEDLQISKLVKRKINSSAKSVKVM